MRYWRISKNSRKGFISRLLNIRLNKNIFAQVTKNLAIVNCFDQPIKRLWRCKSRFIFSLGEEDAHWILQVSIYMFSSDGRAGFWGFPPSQ
jgi:hypothetical protein